MWPLYSGTGSGGTSVAFNARQEPSARGCLVNGQVIWASFVGTLVWLDHGLPLQRCLGRNRVLNVAPNSAMRASDDGGAPAADAMGNIYSTGNGTFDATTNDYGDSAPSSGLAVSDRFTPSNEGASPATMGSGRRRSAII
jgi:hypothetical protein